MLYSHLVKTLLHLAGQILQGVAHPRHPLDVQVEISRVVPCNLLQISDIGRQFLNLCSIGRNPSIRGGALLQDKLYGLFDVHGSLYHN